MITQIKKRDGSTVNFEPDKIVTAIHRANLEAEENLKFSENYLIEDIIGTLSEIDGIVTVENVHDTVEEALMSHGLLKTAKAYILYRDRKNRERQRDLFKHRLAMKPYEYPELLDFKSAIQQSYWIHPEFNYTSDIHDFKYGVEPHERTTIKNAMLAIAQIEIAVKTFWGNLYHHMPKSEIGAVGYTFAESEVRHSEAYSHLLEILGLNDEFNRILEIPALKERVEYLTKSIAWSKTGENRDYVLSILLFSLFIEHVSLFSQFLIMMSFNKHKNLFRGVSNVIEATSKEEQIHGLFGIELINILREEQPQWFDDDMKQAVIDACKESYEAEKKVVKWIYEDGELDFLPEKTVLEFIKNRMNNSLESIGYEKIFDIDEDILEDVEWFDDEVISTKLTDFLSKRSVNYTKFNLSITPETLFSPNSDLIPKKKKISKNDINILLRMRMIQL